MKSLTKVLLFSLVLMLAGFNAVEELIPGESKSNLTRETATVNDVINSSKTFINYIDIGNWEASWYGTKFHGRKTASGEIFDQESFTAAHKTLEFGTLLRLTNPENDRSVIVRINDRGPFIRKRQLDVSRAAAAELGIIENGVAKLKVEQISLQGVNFPVLPFN
ncbi:MAG: septal ring lytic transglycosylase RlpA family protein [Ignavibacteriaceae bacterium]